MKITSNSEDQTPHYYKCQAVLVHIPRAGNGGHYITYRQVNGEWMRFDDEHVSHHILLSCKNILNREHKLSNKV